MVGTKKHEAPELRVLRVPSGDSGPSIGIARSPAREFRAVGFQDEATVAVDVPPGLGGMPSGTDARDDAEADGLSI